MLCPLCGHLRSSRALFCGSYGQRLPRTPKLKAAYTTGADLRFCTVLFADLVCSTELVAEMDFEQAMERLRYYLATMRNGIERFGGTIPRCEAAFELQRRVHALARGVAPRVGIHSGDVVCVPPSPSDLAPEAHGLTVHNASRLAALAEPGTVYLSASCARLAQGRRRRRIGR